MQFSLEWLTEICPVREDVHRIAEALTSRGLTVDAVTRPGDHPVLDVDVPANRPDCLGHLGLAREIGAAFSVPLRTAPPPLPGPAMDVRVEVEDPADCPRYTARRIDGVRVGPSPAWVRRRLEACGLRSVDSVVDASNLVLLGLGHPIHFFDLERIERDAGERRTTVRVRRARSGERLTTLDGVERVLEPSDIVIADERRAVALAGIIGGADSAVGPSTRSVLCEAAVFRPRSVRATAKRLGLRTESSFRFERGVDPEGPLAAQALAARLLAELAGGEPLPAWSDVRTGPEPAKKLVLRKERLERLLGYQPSVDTVRAALEALGLTCAPDAQGITVAIPSWRLDLEREADLVEEVARHLGYDRIPAILPDLGVVGNVGATESSQEDKAREILAHLGFLEGLGYAMIAAGEDEPFVLENTPPPLSLTNPIAEPLACLRRSICPGLVRAADFNFRRGTRDLRLFELGRVFLSSGPGGFPSEPSRLGLVWSGAAEPRHFSRPAREVDLHDVRGIVEHVIGALRPGRSWPCLPGGPPGLHPGRSARWMSDDRPIAWCGALHPELQRALDQEVYLAEVELAALGPDSPPASYEPLSRYPAVSRDLSFIAPRELAWERVSEALRAVAAPAPSRIVPVDRYEGPPLDEQEVSLSVRFTLEPHDRTLTDVETEVYRTKLIECLEQELRVRIRG